MSNSDFEDYDYDSGEEWPENEEEVDETQVEIENTFYEADGKFYSDVKKTSPDEALKGFKKVLELEANHPENENQWRFKALTNVVILQSKLGDYEDMCRAHEGLLNLMDNVARNDATDAINGIIDSVSKLPNTEYAMKLYKMTVERLKEGRNARLWFNTLYKLAKLYLEREDIYNASESISELVKSCQLPDGSDDLSKGQSLLEAYSLEIQLCILSKNTKRMKEIYERTEKINADISDPRIMGVIRESGSKMFMAEKQWEKARAEFFEAFKYYQEVGNPRAKTILKYVVLASILSDSKINPFDSQEAKVFKDDFEIIAMMRLRTAYESNDIDEIQGILNDKTANILNDSFIANYLDELLRSVRLNIMQVKIKPYKSVRIQFLAQELHIQESQVLSLLIELLIEGKVQGKIDEIEGYLEVYSETSMQGLSRRDKAIQKWSSTLNLMQGNMVDKLRF